MKKKSQNQKVKVFHHVTSVASVASVASAALRLWETPHLPFRSMPISVGILSTFNSFIFNPTGPALAAASKVKADSMSAVMSASNSLTVVAV